MAENETPEFDPRFDPAFQRGFEGTPAQRDPARPQYTPPQPVTGYARTNAGASTTVPRREPIAAWEQALAAPESESVLDDELDRGVVDDISRDPEPTYVPGRNPFLIVLLALSVLLIAGGIGGLQWLRNKFLASDIATDLDFVTLQSSTITASIAIGLGLATAIGVLFIYAVRWRGHRV